MRRLARMVIPTVPLVVIMLVLGTAPSEAASNGPAARDTSPVDLATPIRMGAGLARSSAIVHVGPVRVEVLTPKLLRLEYSPAQHFENTPTVNALNRRMAVPPYSFSTSGGWLTVRTAKATLRYKIGSGPFTPLNTSLQLTVEIGPRPSRRRGNGSALSPRCAKPEPPPWGEAPPSVKRFPATRAPRVMPDSPRPEPASPGTSSEPQQVRPLCRCATTTWRAHRCRRPQLTRPGRERAPSTGIPPLRRRRHNLGRPSRPPFPSGRGQTPSR